MKDGKLKTSRGDSILQSKHDQKSIQCRLSQKKVVRTDTSAPLTPHRLCMEGSSSTSSGVHKHRGPLLRTDASEGICRHKPEIWTESGQERHCLRQSQQLSRFFQWDDDAQGKEWTLTFQWDHAQGKEWTLTHTPQWHRSKHYCRKKWPGWGFISLSPLLLCAEEIRFAHDSGWQLGQWMNYWAITTFHVFMCFPRTPRYSITLDWPPTQRSSNKPRQTSFFFLLHHIKEA